MLNVCLDLLFTLLFSFFFVAYIFFLFQHHVNADGGNLVIDVVAIISLFGPVLFSLKLIIDQIEQNRYPWNFVEVHLLSHRHK